MYHSKDFCIKILLDLKKCPQSKNLKRNVSKRLCNFMKQHDWCWFRFLIGREGGANVLHLSHPLVLQN